MNRLAIIIAIVFVAGAAWAGGDVHWGYSGDHGPEHWATLCADFGECAGHNQSPINLTDFVEADLPALGFSYAAGGVEIHNNGHAVQVNYAEGSTLTSDGADYALKQFHFHSPSENQIDGKNFAMECHLVHADADGNLAVVSLMIDKGGENAALAKLWAEMPAKAGDANDLPAKFDIDDLLPADRDYYQFNGSLTTPPCTEGVRWYVLKTPATASADQVEAFTSVMGHPNNRPVQATNARLILK